MYRIKPLQLAKARKIGVQIRPSTRAGKKIDVYKNGRKVASIGAHGYFDYATHIERNGLQFANNRRKLYNLRHRNNMRPGTPGYYAAKILW
jgi:hypothetical protein